MPTPRRTLDLSADEFRAAGHVLVDRIAELISGMDARPVTPAEEPLAVREALGDGTLPEHGTPAAQLLAEATSLVFEHSLFNGHPRFFGYITSSAAPVGMLADLLVGAVNPNVGAWELAPIATEIELQTLRWIAELLGYPTSCGGILVSGGNMANFVCFLAGRRAMEGERVRERGMSGEPRAIYCSAETHTWVKKAADLFGYGTDAIRWIDVDDEQRMQVAALRAAIAEDRARRVRPLMVVATAGSVSTGAVDPLPEIAAVCREHGLWLHADGAYGAPAALVPEAPEDLRALALADSVAMDPHKWLYAPLEAGCSLVKRPEALRDAFSYMPSYYHFDHAGEQVEPPVNFYELGLQNSRGFRALKVWLGLRQAGRAGYREMISDDCRLARRLRDRVAAESELRVVSCQLSIVTFRFVPSGSEGDDPYLDRLNEALLNRLKLSGEVFLSNAVIRDRFLLRACIVNFRTTEGDVDAIPEIVLRHGRAVHDSMRNTNPDVVFKLS